MTNTNENSNLLELPQGDTNKLPSETNPKGCWSGALHPHGYRTALVRCPECGQLVSLSNHTILPDGTVKPSLECPYSTCKLCKFHKWVRLLDWSPDVPYNKQEPNV